MIKCTSCEVFAADFCSLQAEISLFNNTLIYSQTPFSRCFDVYRREFESRKDNIMTTRAQSRTQMNPNQNQNRQHLLLAGLVVILVILIGVFVQSMREIRITPAQPASRQITVAQPVSHVSTQLAGYVLESYTLVNPYTGHNCTAIERYINSVGEEHNRCYSSLALPPLVQIVSTPFGLDEEQTAAVLNKADSVLFMPSPARRLGADAAYFHVGTQVFYAFWLAGDCTPRIIDGHGGYWQMPVSPVYGGPENVPYGAGYLIHLPENWQLDWRTPVEEAAAWRLCSGNTFWYGGQR